MIRFLGLKTRLIPSEYRFCRTLDLFSTEQAFLTYAMKERSWCPEKWVRSFKRHSIRPLPFNLFLPPVLPKGVRILAFHGKPDPDEALRGYPSKKIHYRTLPAPWLADYWG